MFRAREWLTVFAVAALALLVPAGAHATVGEIEFSGCITAGGTPASGCTNVSGTTNALEAIQSVAVSADGTSLYAASSDRDSVAHLVRNPLTGALSFADCITGGNTPATGCTDISLTTNAFGFLDGVAVSPDGSSVYTAGNGQDAVARLSRDPSSGALSFGNCITGGNTPATGCTDLSGTTTSLDGNQSVAVSADGTSIYTVSDNRDAVAHLIRDPSTGALSFADCITGGDTLATGCTNVSVTTNALDQSRSVAVSADGRSVYTTSSSRDAIAHFTRDPLTGALSFAGCITAGDTPATGCTDLSATTNALASTFSVAVSADGRNVYTGSAEKDAVTHLVRDPSTGALSFVGCITAGATPATGCTDLSATTNALDQVRSVAVSADGASVYAASVERDAVTHLARDPSTGALSFAACFTAGAFPATGCTDLSATTNGLEQARSVAVSADGTSVYVAAVGAAAVAHFRRQVAPVCTNTVTAVPHNEAMTVPLSCSDANGDPITRSIASGPSHGILGPVDQTAGTVSYTPNPGYTGPDSFTFRAADARDTSNTAIADLVVADLLPGRCANLLRGTNNGETLTGTRAGDRILALRGNDVLKGLRGDDCLLGGSGRDRLAGGPGEDGLSGGPGKDRLSGGSGKDRLSGGRGRDTLSGGRAKDSFNGGSGADTIKSADGRKERVRCGKGKDRVRADAADRLLGCERVRRV